jgi:hypothetical protein
VSARYEISIEVLDGDPSAEIWRVAWGDILTSTAVEHGAVEWRWLHRTWGVVFEVAFDDEAQFDLWRELPVVRSAFDAAPDPISGIVFHRGWGGTSGSGEPRRPRPIAGAGAAELGFDSALDRVVDALSKRVRRTAMIEPDEAPDAAASI